MKNGTHLSLILDWFLSNVDYGRKVSVDKFRYKNRIKAFS